MIAITPTLFLEDQEVEERFVRASGPGGQNVNKVATAVEPCQGKANESSDAGDELRYAAVSTAPPRKMPPATTVRTAGQ